MTEPSWVAEVKRAAQEAASSAALSAMEAKSALLTFRSAQEAASSAALSAMEAKSALLTFHGEIAALNAELIVYAIAYIKNTAGEFLLFLIGLQPKEIQESSLFRETPLMTDIARDIGKDVNSIIRVFDRVVVGRNQVAHCATFKEVEHGIQNCLLLLERHPNLSELAKDASFVIKNSTAISKVKECRSMAKGGVHSKGANQSKNGAGGDGPGRPSLAVLAVTPCRRSRGRHRAIKR